MRLFSAMTNITPCSTKSRPTTLLLARSSTSTMEPSLRPRRSTPVTRASTMSPCRALCICLGPRKRSSLPSSGLQEAEAVGVADDLALDEPGLVGDEDRAAAVAHDLPFALHGGQAPREAPRARRAVDAEERDERGPRRAARPRGSSTSRIISRLGRGCSYLAASRAWCGSACPGPWFC